MAVASKQKKPSKADRAPARKKPKDGRGVAAVRIRKPEVKIIGPGQRPAPARERPVHQVAAELAEKQARIQTPFSRDEWFKLPYEARRRWWRETDYSTKPASDELLAWMNTLIEKQKANENDGTGNTDEKPATNGPTSGSDGGGNATA